MSMSRTAARKSARSAGTARQGVTLDTFVWQGTDKRGIKMKGEQQAKNANLLLPGLGSWFGPQPQRGAYRR